MTNRELLENQQPGVPVGSFVVKPFISENFGYSSSALGTPNSSSSEIESSAGVRVNSDWTRNSLGASLNVDDRRYLDVPVASFTNWTAGVGGSVDIGSDTITLGYSHLNLNLSATSFGVFGVVAPVPYSVNDVRLGYAALRGRFSFTPSAEFQEFSFGEAAGSVPISYASLSHNLESGSLAGRYAFSTGNAAVVILRGTGAQFGGRGDGGNDYQDVTAYAGLDFRSDAVIQYRVLVGAETRSFNAPHSRAVTGPAAELDTVWTPRRVDTVTLGVSHHLDDPESPFARNQTVTTVQLRIDHELLRNVVLTGTGSAGWSDSQSVASGGTDFNQTQTQFGLSAEWAVNRYMRLSFFYNYNHSDYGTGVPTVTTLNGSSRSSFTSNTVGISVSGAE